MNEGEFNEDEVTAMVSDVPEMPPSSPPPERPPPAAASKRFRVETSQIDGSLADFVAQGLIDNEFYNQVAERILNEGILPLSEAAKIIGVKHTTRAMEKLKKELPVEMFASSRKEGYFIVPHTEEHHASFLALVKRNRELEEALSRFGNFDRENFAQIDGLLNPQEKILMRYLLTKMYGVEKASKEFGVTQQSLRVIEERVAEAIITAGEGETSTHLQKKVYHDKLKPPARGKKKAWEEDEDLSSFVMGLIQKAVWEMFYSCIYEYRVWLFIQA